MYLCHESVLKIILESHLFYLKYKLAYINYMYVLFLFTKVKQFKTKTFINILLRFFYTILIN